MGVGKQIWELSKKIEYIHKLIFLGGYYFYAFIINRYTFELVVIGIVKTVKHKISFLKKLLCFNGSGRAS